MASCRLAIGQTTARQHIRFDDNWKFRTDPNTKIGGTPISSWEWTTATGVTVLDGNSIPDSLGTANWRRARIGQDVFRNRPGFAWFRADLGSNLAVPAGQKRVLHFDSVDDNCEVFVNGQLMRKHYVWDDPFDVQLDSAWHEGSPNKVVVLVENTDGGGGVAGPVTLHAAKDAELPEFAKPGFNDKAWRVVQVPHDYLLEGKFTPTADASHGSLPQIPAWYRKTFFIPGSYKWKSLWLEFDGVYRNSVLWLNGHKLGSHTSGYVGFRHDIAPYVHYGSKNVISVFVDPRQSEGWWYEGAGIYRHVWLNVADLVHVAPNGTFVDSTVSGSQAKLSIQTTVSNGTTKQKSCIVISDVYGPDGRKVGTVKSTAELDPNSSHTVTQTAVISRPRLWSIERPQLYRMQTTLVRSQLKTLPYDWRRSHGDAGPSFVIERTFHPVDSVDTTFGIRTLRFDANKGFFLNGKPLKFKGTCDHQDFIGVGTGMPDSVLYWRIKKLKEMGSNAYRCSHNPPAKELLDACDKLGMVVMDENRHLGNALGGKTPHGTKYDDLPELRELVQRDRNHPSIVIWSMCNEEPLQGSEEGRKIFAAMMKETHKWDTSRPISCAMNGGWGHGITLVEDLQGCNYNPQGYDAFHAKFPKMPMFGSETASAVSSRGEYVNDRQKGYVSAYDLNAPPWAQTAQVAWKMLDDRPFMEGGFVWTGFDYKGEPTPYGWPCINSHFGIMDMCGFPKDSYYYYKSWWGDKPIVHVFPHWNWPGKEGQPINVWVHSNCEQVELFLNGQSLGVKTMPHDEHLEWSVNYTPGSLVAKGYDHHKLIASDRVETTGRPATIVLKTDRTTLSADNEDVTMVEVQVLDAQGRLVPYADNMIHFKVSGAGAVGGVGNGDASCHEPDKASQRSAYHGLCMVLVRANNSPGGILLEASAPGLKGASLSFRSTPRPRGQSVKPYMNIVWSPNPAGGGARIQWWAAHFRRSLPSGSSELWRGEGVGVLPRGYAWSFAYGGMPSDHVSANPRDSCSTTDTRSFTSSAGSSRGDSSSG